MKAEREGYIGNWQAKIYSELTEAGHHLAEYRSSFEKARLRQDLVLLRAPEDGIVLTIGQGSVGSVLQSAGQFITLVPTGYGLEMEAVMRSQDVGFVQVGDHALLKFATFPYDQYGGAEATVRIISADAFTPSSQGAMALVVMQASLPKIPLRRVSIACVCGLIVTRCTVSLRSSIRCRVCP